MKSIIVLSPAQRLVSTPLPCGYKHVVCHSQPSLVLIHTHKRNILLFQNRGHNLVSQMWPAKVLSLSPTGFQQFSESTVKTEEASQNVGFQLLLKT